MSNGINSYSLHGNGLSERKASSAFCERSCRIWQDAQWRGSPAHEAGPYLPNENRVEKFIDRYIDRLGNCVGAERARVDRLAKLDRKGATAGRFGRPAG